MKIPAVKGTRDFYPPQMAIRNFIVDGWKDASLRNGFEEYDGPIFEYLKMFQIKSGDEIIEQLFSLKDRGGRDLAIRPEITPTLARMVNQQINSLPRPIKWFSVPRLCRSERPQRGRLREFFQWNIDIIGIEDVLADAEVIFCSLDYLQQLGLTADDIVARISSRKMLAAVLRSIGIPEDQLEILYVLLDKRNKLPEDTFESLLFEKVSDKQMARKILDVISAESIEQIGEMIEIDTAAKESINELRRLFDLLKVMGVADYCVFDIGIVRGLAYYTGVVFEIYDKGCQLRAIGGGGRYDNLLKDFGGPAVTATGFGMGDCVLAILLEEKGILKQMLPQPSLNYFIAYTDKQLLQKAIEFTARLRRLSISAEFSYKSVNLGKQMKQASARNAQNCIILGDELSDSKLVIKDMETAKQKSVDVDEFFGQF